jgi:SAM-dependent methyltransferase
VSGAAARSRSYGRIASRYEQARGGEGRARQIHDALRPFLRDVATLCDVGVGTGIVADQLTRDGTAVFGVDVSIEMLRQAAVRLPGRVAVADAARLPFSDHSFDAVLFVWVLHHAGDLVAALREAARVVVPGGRVLAISGYADPVPDDIDALFRSLDETLRPERLTHDAEVGAAARGVGLDLEHAGAAVVTVATTPNQLADGVEERLYAPLWELDDERWEAVVVPVIRGLRALPEPDRPRQRGAHHPMWVWRRTESSATTP